MFASRRAMGNRLLLLLLGLLAICFAGLPGETEKEPGMLRKIGRRIKGLFGRNPKQYVTIEPPVKTFPAVAPEGQPQLAIIPGRPPQQLVPGITDARPGRMDQQAVDESAVGVRGRQKTADSAKVVWQSLELPQYRDNKVQEVLELWHMATAASLLDPVHLEELIRNYVTVLDLSSKILFPDLEETIRGFISEIESNVFDMGACSKRLLYLSGIPVVAGRSSESSDIDFRKTKALHTLGVFYVLEGRLSQLSNVVRESSKIISKELTKSRALTAQLARILMAFTRLSRYTLDSLDNLMAYYREMHATIIGSIAYPLLVTRTYSRLHMSLQTVGQFFATCMHCRKIGSGLQREITGLWRGVKGMGFSTAQWPAGEARMPEAGNSDAAQPQTMDPRSEHSRGSNH